MAQLGTVLGPFYGGFMASLWAVLWIICGLVWLWSLVRTKDVKNDMWVVMGKFCQNFLRPVSFFFFFFHNLAYGPPNWIILVGDET